MAATPKNTDFHANASEPTASLLPGFSLWEHRGWLSGIDALVVGAGIVGMNAALALKKARPSWKVVVMDRVPFGGGGTTRNAGFACVGSPSELLEDLETLGEQATTQLVAMRWKGLEQLREMWGDDALGYVGCGSVEAFTSPALWEQTRAALPRLNALLANVFPSAPFHEVPCPSGLHQLEGTIACPLEGMLDTTRLVQTLRNALDAHAIPLLTGLSLSTLSPCQDGWRVTTPAGTFDVPRVMLATNALAAQWVDVDVAPVDNHVLVSHPLSDLALRHTVHHDRGYVYARPVGDRVLLGGGRQWGLDAAQTVARLTAWGRTHLHPEFAPAHHWVGQLGVGTDRWPVVKTAQPRLHIAVRLGGMGVAIGTEMGLRLADLAARDEV